MFEEQNSHLNLSHCSGQGSPELPFAGRVCGSAFPAHVAVGHSPRVPDRQSCPHRQENGHGKDCENQGRKASYHLYYN